MKIISHDGRSTLKLTSAREFVTQLIILSDGSLYYSTISALLLGWASPGCCSALCSTYNSTLHTQHDTTQYTVHNIILQHY